MPFAFAERGTGVLNTGPHPPGKPSATEFHTPPLPVPFKTPTELRVIKNRAKLYKRDTLMFNVAEHLLGGAPLHLRATVTLRVSTVVPLI